MASAIDQSVNPDRPSLKARLLVATAVATAAAFVTWTEFARWPGVHHSDFSPLWFSARAFIRGANPYALIGPGRPFDFDWPEYYPATAFVAALPFAWLPEKAASIAFIWVSTALLAFAVVRKGWYRLPLFLSVSFVIAARAAELSPLLAAGLCLPAVGLVYAAKPNLGLALLTASWRLRPAVFAAAGGCVLLAISLVVAPWWPRVWLSIVTSTTQHGFPIAQPGGFLVLLALLRWRRPEARLIVALACIPQTIYWYEGLYLLLIPATFRESLLLSLISSTGFLVERTMVGWRPNEPYVHIGLLMIAFLYLPATIMVLRRPNEPAQLC